MSTNSFFSVNESFSKPSNLHFLRKAHVDTILASKKGQD